MAASRRARSFLSSPARSLARSRFHHRHRWHVSRARQHRASRSIRAHSIISSLRSALAHCASRSFSRSSPRSRYHTSRRIYILRSFCPLTLTCLSHRALYRASRHRASPPYRIFRRSRFARARAPRAIHFRARLLPPFTLPTSLSFHSLALPPCLTPSRLLSSILSLTRACCHSHSLLTHHSCLLSFPHLALTSLPPPPACRLHIAYFPSCLLLPCASCLLPSLAPLACCLLSFLLLLLASLLFTSIHSSAFLHSSLYTSRACLHRVYHRLSLFAHRAYRAASAAVGPAHDAASSAS